MEAPKSKWNFFNSDKNMFCFWFNFVHYFYFKVRLDKLSQCSWKSLKINWCSPFGYLYFQLSIALSIRMAWQGFEPTSNCYITKNINWVVNLLWLWNELFVYSIYHIRFNECKIEFNWSKMDWWMPDNCPEMVCVIRMYWGGGVKDRFEYPWSFSSKCLGAGNHPKSPPSDYSTCNTAS